MMRSACLTAVLFLACGNLLADDAPPRTISTSGEALIYVTPDEVVINFGVETRDKKLSTAKELNDDASKNLVQALKKLGIKDQHIQTAHLEVSLIYIDNQRLTIEGYRAHRRYCVLLKDVKLFEKVVETALGNGANQLASFDYRTTELRKYRDQARANAILAAKQKAEALAHELQCNVGQPRTISEGSMWSGYFGGARDQFANSSQNSVQSAPPVEAGDSETLPVGQIAVRADVSVTFDLLTAKIIHN